MRNVGGAMAQRKLTRAIIATLSVAGISYNWLSAKSNTWIHGTEDDSDIEMDANGLSWSNGHQDRTIRYNLTAGLKSSPLEFMPGHQDRTIRYNLTVPFLKKNVDLCLFNCRYQELSVSYKNLAFYFIVGDYRFNPIILSL